MAGAGRLDEAALRRCVASATAFASTVLGVDFFGYQEEIAEDPARYRAILGGRQIGKSTLLGALALHRAWSQPGAHVLVAAPIDDAAKRLMDTCVTLARGAPLLAGSVVDDQKHLLTLSNGSVVRSIPSSIRQAIGWTVDLLVTDESGYLDEAFWEHLEPVVVARPGSRVVAASTPWGGPGHWFRAMWERGADSPDGWCRSWRLPASVSPLIDKGWLEEKRRTASPDYFARMFEAEWTDVSGSYFAESELMDAVADYELITPEEARGAAAWSRWADGLVRERPFSAVGGADWAYSRDKSTAVLLAVLADGGANRETVFYVPWCEGHHGLAYHAMVEKWAEIARGWRLHAVASELNGPGVMPTQELRRRLAEEGLPAGVHGVWTDQRAKAAGFSAIKGGLQRGTLVLPRHPGLLAELRGLVYEETPSGGLRIGPAAGKASPDLAMGLMQAARCMRPAPNLEHGPFSAGDFAQQGAVRLPTGTWFPPEPRPSESAHGFISPQGAERRDANAW